MLKRKGLIGWIAGASSLLALALVGCGGGSGSGTQSISGGTPPPIAHSSQATALFHVDVKSGKVTVTPTQEPASRATFSGSAIKFNSSVLIDQPSTQGIKSLSVSMTNNWGLPIGVDPNGTVNGLRVLFGPLTDVTPFSDARGNTTVSTLATSGLSGPSGVAVLSGALYIADQSDNQIKKFQGGVTSTLAGAAAPGSVDGVGSAARFNAPVAIAANPVDGALVVADFGGNRIRRVTAAGTVSTIAITNAISESDSGPAGVAVDATGVIYFTTFNGNRVRKIVLTPAANPTLASSYTTSTVAGSGTAGSADGLGAAASFSGPRGIAVAADGTLSVTDQRNNTIRQITPAGQVTTIAGTGVAGSSNGAGNVATFTSPFGIVLLNGSLFVSDGNNVRQLSQFDGSWRVGYLAGTGSAGLTDGAGNVAMFNSPMLMATDGSGNLLVADFANNKIRQVSPVAGSFPIGIPSGPSSTNLVQLTNQDGAQPVPGGTFTPYIRYSGSLGAGATSAAKNWNFEIPAGVTAFEFTITVEGDPSALTSAEGASGVGSNKVLVRTSAGDPNHSGFLNGPTASARFGSVEFVATDPAGEVFVSDRGNSAIRMISPTGQVGTIAGSGSSGFVDGSGAVAKFSANSALAVSPDGNTVYVADSGNERIRRISFTGGSRTDPTNWFVVTIAGTGTAGGTYFSAPGSTATFNFPTGLAMDGGGNLYVSEFVGNRVRRITFIGGDPTVAANYNVTLVAGDTSSASPAGAFVDSASGSSARFSAPDQICVDQNGQVYVGDSANNRVRAITVDGATTTLAGSGSSTYADGVGITASFWGPSGVAADSAGNVYVVETVNNRVRVISKLGVVTTIAGTGSGATLDGTGDIATFTNPRSICVTAAGTLYVGGNGDSCIRSIQRIIGVGTH